MPSTRCVIISTRPTPGLNYSRVEVSIALEQAGQQRWIAEWQHSCPTRGTTANVPAMGHESDFTDAFDAVMDINAYHRAEALLSAAEVVRDERLSGAVLQARGRGDSIRVIAEQLGVSKSTVGRVLALDNPRKAEERRAALDDEAYRMLHNAAWRGYPPAQM